jgi:hypothetical protein
MTITQNLTLAIIGSACVALSAFFITVSPAEAARSDAKIIQVQTGGSKASTSRPLVDRSCMQGAVNTREASIKNAFSTYTNSITAALDKRVTAFSSVWSGTEVSSNETYRSIWGTWKKSNEEARKKLRSEREVAWKTYRETATKTCKAKLPKEETAQQDAGTSAI